MDYEALFNEITNDPEAIGYSGMTDAEIATALNAETQQVDRTSITKQELWENTSLTEYAALTAAARQAYGVLIDMDNIDVTAGSNSRVTLAALFAAGSTTRANLLALVDVPVTTSRAEILSLGLVTTGDVERAKAFGAGE